MVDGVWDFLRSDAAPIDGSSRDGDVLEPRCLLARPFGAAVAAPTHQYEVGQSLRTRGTKRQAGPGEHMQYRRPYAIQTRTIRTLGTSYNVPFVEGMSACCGLRETAIRRARAVLLKRASARW